MADNAGSGAAEGLVIFSAGLPELFVSVPMTRAYVSLSLGSRWSNDFVGSIETVSSTSFMIVDLGLFVKSVSLKVS